LKTDGGFPTYKQIRENKGLGVKLTEHPNSSHTKKNENTE